MLRHGLQIAKKKSGNRGVTAVDRVAEEQVPR